ncbi:hypothetical protein DRQ33_07105 [bacterium]|nr:MAG: hypothetical protein DRQ33_07105 [bacterium]
MRKTILFDLVFILFTIALGQEEELVFNRIWPPEYDPSPKLAVYIENTLWDTPTDLELKLQEWADYISSDEDYQVIVYSVDVPDLGEIGDKDDYNNELSNQLRVHIKTIYYSYSPPSLEGVLFVGRIPTPIIDEKPRVSYPGDGFLPDKTTTAWFFMDLDAYWYNLDEDDSYETFLPMEMDEFLAYESIEDFNPRSPEHYDPTICEKLLPEIYVSRLPYLPHYNEVINAVMLAKFFDASLSYHRGEINYPDGILLYADETLESQTEFINIDDLKDQCFSKKFESGNIDKATYLSFLKMGGQLGCHLGHGNLTLSTSRTKIYFKAGCLNGLDPYKYSLVSPDTFSESNTPILVNWFTTCHGGKFTYCDYYPFDRCPRASSPAVNICYTRLYSNSINSLASIGYFSTSWGRIPDYMYPLDNTFKNFTESFFLELNSAGNAFKEAFELFFTEREHESYSNVLDELSYNYYIILGRDDRFDALYNHFNTYEYRRFFPQELVAPKLDLILFGDPTIKYRNIKPVEDQIFFAKYYSDSDGEPNGMDIYRTSVHDIDIYGGDTTQEVRVVTSVPSTPSPGEMRLFKSDTWSYKSEDWTLIDIHRDEVLNHNYDYNIWYDPDMDTEHYLKLEVDYGDGNTFTTGRILNNGNRYEIKPGWNMISLPVSAPCSEIIELIPTIREGIPPHVIINQKKYFSEEFEEFIDIGDEMSVSDIGGRGL